MLSAGKVEHTTARNVARVRLMDSQEPVIYVTDGCAPGKDTVPVSYATESLAADLAAVIIGVYLCAGIGQNSWAGHSVTFCSPQKNLWRPERKGSNVLYFYVPVLELEELLSMKRALPAYEVRHTEPYIAACWLTVCEHVLLKVLPVLPLLNWESLCRTSVRSP